MVGDIKAATGVANVADKAHHHVVSGADVNLRLRLRVAKSR